MISYQIKYKKLHTGNIANSDSTSPSPSRIISPCSDTNYNSWCFDERGETALVALLIRSFFLMPLCSFVFKILINKSNILVSVSRLSYIFYRISI